MVRLNGAHEVYNYMDKIYITSALEFRSALLGWQDDGCLRGLWSTRGCWQVIKWFLPFDPSEFALNSDAFGFWDSIVSDIIIVFEANQ